MQTYAIIFHWQGADTTLKPILVTSHQGEGDVDDISDGLTDQIYSSTSVDVVPVDPETVAQWKYPPYSGFYDGMSIISLSICFAIVILYLRP